MFGGVYSGRRVLVSGHSGFKGSNLCFWLERMGAVVAGCSLPPATEPALFPLLRLSAESEWCDVRDRRRLSEVFRRFRPEIVFHLAAQPLVRASFRDPAGTFEINVQGTVNVLECCRSCGSVRAAVVVTSDKCYRNRSRAAAYAESAPLGGDDPYSASKACAELAAACYREAFWEEDRRVLAATARAGNVIGGGDWAADRLIPDLIRSAAAGRVAELRRPDAVRPWQHVWEALSGYLLLGEKLLEGRRSFASAWNFGPPEESCMRVREVAGRLSAFWPSVRFECADAPSGPREADALRLNCGRAAGRLGWRPVWSLDEALRRTAHWYRAFYERRRVSTREDLRAYIGAAEEKGLTWTN